MMNGNIQARMAEATRLTQEGRLNEATALIQNALGNPSAASGDTTTVRHDRPIDVASRLIKETPQGPAPHRGTGPNLRSRGVRHPSGKSGGRAAGTQKTGGQFVDRSYSGAAGGRSYKLYVPTGYTGEAVPLVVMLHGCTQDPDDFAAGTRMNALAEEHGFLVSYPAQSGNANMQKCWNWFQPADQGRGRGEPAIIAGITRQVMEEYKVDEGRVYVAGMSAGGAMAAIMGATYPDLYTAVGVHSGLAPGSAHDMPSAFSAMSQGNPGAPMPKAGSNGQAKIPPTVVFHGDRDGTVHPRNGERLLANLTAGDGSSLKVSTRQGQVPDGHAFTRISYRDADGRSVVERWNVHGLGHAWSGGGRPGSYTDPKGPDASAEMVRFFQQHARTK
ncbi:MAG: PHB depolymerase family esterase [Actinomycetota bacterium]|jgi:poly(hydroxyalkanoate) depolymerase family esterase|nr:PHB depolymerase family esterase [Actinomycetota bacterium]